SRGGPPRTPTGALGPPSAGIQPQVRAATMPRPRTTSAATKETAIAAIETTPAPRPVRRSDPTTASSTNETNGIASTRSGRSTSAVTALAPEQGEAGGPAPPAPAGESREGPGAPRAA